MEIGTGGLNGNKHGLGVRRDCMDGQKILSHLKVHLQIYMKKIKCTYQVTDKTSAVPLSPPGEIFNSMNGLFLIELYI